MLFSVIIPVYNGERYLPDCLISLNNQSYQDFEVLVVDDGSSDGSGEIADHYASLHGNARVLHGENQGPLLARRRGLSQCQGDYVVFLDADDMLRFDALERLACCIAETGADIVSFRFSRNADFSTKDDDTYVTEGFYKGDDYRLFQRAVCSARWNNLCGKAIHLSHIDFDTNYTAYAGLMMAEDLFQLLPIADSANTFAFIDEAMYFYRPSEMSNTAVFKHSYIADAEFVSKRLLEYGCAWGLKDVAERGVCSLYINVLRLFVRHCEMARASTELDEISKSLNEISHEAGKLIFADERFDRKFILRNALRCDLRQVCFAIHLTDFVMRGLRQAGS